VLHYGKTRNSSLNTKAGHRLVAAEWDCYLT
jgi:hypothetical protein